MLGKLIKYEWQGLRKPLSILYLVLLGITLLTGILILTINPKYDDVTMGFSVMFTLLSVFLYYFGVIACALGTMLIIAIRFYKTCYTDEAYLTHTLPVSTKQLVAAKTITGALCYILSLILVVITALLLIGVFVTHMMNLGEIRTSDFSSIFWSELNETFKGNMGIGLFSYLGFLGIYCLIGAVCGCISILGCVSLGQLYTKHRILGAIIAYFALTTIQQIFSYIAMIPMYGQMIEADYSGKTISMFSLMGPSFLVLLIITIVIAVIMYFVNLTMMTKHLNLE